MNYLELISVLKNNLRFYPLNQITQDELISYINITLGKFADIVNKLGYTDYIKSVMCDLWTSGDAHKLSLDGTTAFVKKNIFSSLVIPAITSTKLQPIPAVTPPPSNIESPYTNETNTSNLMSIVTDSPTMIDDIDSKIKADNIYLITLTQLNRAVEPYEMLMNIVRYPSPIKDVEEFKTDKYPDFCYGFTNSNTIYIAIALENGFDYIRSVQGYIYYYYEPVLYTSLTKEIDVRNNKVDIFKDYVLANIYKTNGMTIPKDIYMNIKRFEDGL